MSNGPDRINQLRGWVAHPELAERPTTVWRYLAILAAVFLAARGFVILAILTRGMPLVRSDGHNYIYIAETVLSEGVIPLDQRQSPGFGVLIALFARLTFLDPVTSGLLLMLLPGVGAVWLFYLLTRNLPLSLLLVFFLPGWASSGIMAESLTVFCVLCTVAAFDRNVTPVRGALLAFAGGFLVTIKPTLALAIVPLGAVAVWGAFVQGRRDLLLRGILFWIPFGVLALWLSLTVGVIFPEAEGHRLYTIEQSRGYYPERLLTWPGHSLTLGLMDRGESPLKQGSVLFNLALALAGAVGLLLLGNARTQIGSTGTLLGLGVVFHTVFHLSVGGPWGFNTMERYLGQISPLILVGLFANHRPKWWLLVGAAGLSLAYTSLAGRQM